MAEHQLAHRHERKARSFRRRPCAHSGRTTAADQGQGPATSARRGGLAHRRTQDVGREETLSRQPAGKDGPAHLGGHHQGAMDLRAGSPAAERRTRSRSLRGTILARPSPSCAHDDDRLRLPPASPPRSSKAGKKESTGHRLSQLCQPCATPSSNSSLDYRRSDARIAENGFAAGSGVSKSAKVVLVPVAIIARSFSASAANRWRMNGSTSGPSSATNNGTRCAMSPEMNCTSRLSRSSLATAKGHRWRRLTATHCKLRPAV